MWSPDDATRQRRSPPGNSLLHQQHRRAGIRVSEPHSVALGIENTCHRVLDTAFREDHNPTYIGYAAKNLGALRRIVLNLLKLDRSHTHSLPKKRRRAMLDLTYRETLPSLA